MVALSVVELVVLDLLVFLFFITIIFLNKKNGMAEDEQNLNTQNSIYKDDDNFFDNIFHNTEEESSPRMRDSELITQITASVIASITPMLENLKQSNMDASINNKSG